jgi:glutathione synthase/RimK-type ligase-like ATP-grasp enzyme
MAHIALVTARAALAIDPDLPPLVEALQRAGASVSTPFWDDSAVDWSGFDLAVLRSTWDYVERIADFRAWARRCAAQTRLFNPPALLEWNTDKHYLQHLYRAGVAVVPTCYVEPGADPGRSLRQFLAGGPDSLSVGRPCDFDEFVVKPTIGAGSRDAARYRRADAAPALAHLSRLVAAESRSAMLQPYLASVETAGETALIYYDGVPSHAFRKGPLLRLDAGLVEGLFAPEEISARTAADDERLLAAAAHAAIPFERPLYVRLDMIRDGWGTPVILELEMTEPSMFFAYAPGSADRFATLLIARSAG